MLLSGSCLRVVNFENNNKISEQEESDLRYGLVHMAKTAGTEINGELALNYRRVCGNKGYSFDFTSLNRINQAQNLSGKRKWKGETRIERIMQIGWDECDYIAVEQRATFAPKLTKLIIIYSFYDYPCKWKQQANA